MKPLAIDLFCGLGGWTEGLIAEGYDVVGFDIERHVYGSHRYPAQLVLQDVRTLHGSQFRGATLMVASPPCQAYSWMAMPWKRAKAKAAWYREDPARQVELNELFDACFRIQHEACEAAGRHVPMVVENVCGAQKWVGRARWHYGSYYLWGDVPALMPIIVKRPRFKGGDRNIGRANGTNQWISVDVVKVGGLDWSSEDKSKRGCFRDSSFKNAGGSWFGVAHNTTSGKGQNPIKIGGRLFPNEAADRGDGVKQPGLANRAWFDHGMARHPSKSSKRKAASAMIAKIPLELARHIGSVYRKHPM